MSDSGFMDAMEKIICVTRESERRHLERRASDRTERDKARRFDQLMVDVKFNFEFWSKLCCSVAADTPTAKALAASLSYYAGRAHTYAAILQFYGGQTVECPCPACAYERMEAKEAVLKNLSELAQKERR